MDNFLNKFDDIEINNNSRISEEDQIFCEEQERMYNEFIIFSDDYLEYLKNNSLSNNYYSSTSLISEMDKTRDYKKDMFISKLVDYFRDKYRVTLKAEPIQKKYTISITHDIIINEIIEQLGGYNFEDKAEKEIKDEFKNCLRHDKIKIRNTKISIESFFYIDSWDLKYKSYKVSYNSDEKFYKLFKALSHFLFKSNQSYYGELYNIITREENDNVFKIHDIANNGVKTLKIYKNGKIDLEFSNTEYAQKFAKEYCGYIGSEQKTV
jgi:hypothetical protein